MRIGPLLIIWPQSWNLLLLSATKVKGKGIIISHFSVDFRSFLLGSALPPIAALKRRFS